MDKDQIDRQLKRIEKAAGPVAIGVAIAVGFIVSLAQIRRQKARRRQWFVPVLVILVVILLGLIGAIVEHVINSQPQLSCLNGTYTMNSGAMTCRAAYSTGIPAGATAHCNDGTYSFNQDDSSVCSRHGGVQTVL